MSRFDKVFNRENTRAIKLEYRDRVFGKPDVIPLWVADMDFSAPPAVVEAVRQRVEHPLFGYTNRPREFSESIRGWLKRRFNWDTELSWIDFCPGVVPNLGLAVQAFTNPGDGVVIQPPVYPPFFGVIKDFGREVVENPLKETDDGYRMDFEQLEMVTASPRTKLLLLCHPHNPVGRVWTEQELLTLGEICKRNKVTIISDEIHCDLTLFGHQHKPLASISPDLAEITLTCMSPSKSFNLAGLSTSYMVASNPSILNPVKAQIGGHHLHMGNTFGAIALEAAYNSSEAWLDELKQYLEGNIMVVADFLNKYMPEVKTRLPEATYLMWLDFRCWQMNSSALKKFMVHQAGLGLNDGVTFGKEGRGFMRMNVASPREIIIKALDRLHAAYLEK